MNQRSISNLFNHAKTEFVVLFLIFNIKMPVLFSFLKKRLIFAGNRKQTIK